MDQGVEQETTIVSTRALLLGGHAGLPRGQYLLRRQLRRNRSARSTQRTQITRIILQLYTYTPCELRSGTPLRLPKYSSPARRKSHVAACACWLLPHASVLSGGPLLS